MAFDLLLKGGTLIDPSQGVHGIKDIAFKDGRVEAVADDLGQPESVQMIDCSNRFVSPGWIDLHVHAFWGCSHYGIEPDPNFIANGVTTALDVGSAGADTFAGFRRYVIEASDTRLFAYLHISSMGMLSGKIGELKYMEYADVEKAVETVEQHRDLILGIKVRLTQGLVDQAAGLQPLHLARKAADEAGLPIMVHPNEAWTDSIDNILSVMQAGDILTHCFHGSGCGILDSDGKVRTAVFDARERGVLFDVGHGRGSFKWEVVEQAVKEDLLPHTISSDLHVYSLNGPVFDLATTMSKFLHLGLSLDQVIDGVTRSPAAAMGMPGEIGVLTVGTGGDAVVFDIEEGAFDFYDTHEQNRVGHLRIVPVTVIQEGRVYR